MLYASGKAKCIVGPFIISLDSDDKPSLITTDCHSVPIEVIDELVQRDSCFTRIKEIDWLSGNASKQILFTCTQAQYTRCVLKINNCQ